MEGKHPRAGKFCGEINHDCAQRLRHQHRVLGSRVEDPHPRVVQAGVGGVPRGLNGGHITLTTGHLEHGKAVPESLALVDDLGADLALVDGIQRRMHLVGHAEDGDLVDGLQAGQPCALVRRLLPIWSYPGLI